MFVNGTLRFWGWELLIGRSKGMGEYNIISAHSNNDNLLHQSDLPT